MSKHLRNENIFKLEINDLFIELKEENNRLLNELQFALKFINLLKNQRKVFINRLNCCLNCGSDPQIKEQINSFNEEKDLLFNNKCIQRSGKNFILIKTKGKQNSDKILINFNYNRFENQTKSEKTFENNLLNKKCDKNDMKYKCLRPSSHQSFETGITFTNIYHKLIVIYRFFKYN